MKTNIIVLMLLSFFSAEAMDNAFEKLDRLQQFYYWYNGFKNVQGKFCGETLIKPENSPFSHCYKKPIPPSPEVTIESIINSVESKNIKKQIVEFDLTPEELIPYGILD